MTTFVPDYVLNPAPRQSRRISSTIATPEPLAGRAEDSPHNTIEDGTSTADRETLDPGDPMRRPTRLRPVPLQSGPSPRPASDSSSESDTREGLSTLHISPPSVRPATAAGDGASQPIAIEGPNRIPQQDVSSSLPTSFYGRAELPEDDGMGALRRRIFDIQSKRIPPTEKARLMHNLLMEGYTRSQIARQSRLPIRSHTPSSPTAEQPVLPAGPLDSFKFWNNVLGESTAAQKFTLTDDDIRPTYVPLCDEHGTAPDEAQDEDLGDARYLGCEHYRRNVKLQCFTCERWYTCRLCHNDAEDHVLPRRETRNMLCMLCGHAQRAGEVCAKCGESAARYYCNICKLWNDDPRKSIYHCNDCGICRVGEGLGKDFIHCKKCGSCISIKLEASHRCREGAMDCDCPICGEYMFTSHKKIVSMKCGHMIHEACRTEHIKTSYKCPICSKSVENMESQFRRLDKHLEEQPMPREYEHTRAIILCNDCEAKTSTKYHWGGLKCEVCLSYNTVELQILDSPAVPRAREHTQEAVVVGTKASHPPASNSQDTTAAVASTNYLVQSAEGQEDLRTRSTHSTLPIPAKARPEDGAAVDDSDEEEDMLDLWGRNERRSTASAEITGEDGSEDEDDESASDAHDEVDDDEDDDDEDIVLLGHR